MYFAELLPCKVCCIAIRGRKGGRPGAQGKERRKSELLALVVERDKNTIRSDQRSKIMKADNFEFNAQSSQSDLRYGSISIALKLKVSSRTWDTGHGIFVT
jgi:hypothetical protein